MFLKELEIQGFKSFPDRIKVSIEKGVTCVVGPNGSGKSNISDAIRWVLGETSAKQLRGAGKMENVIFGGTQMRGAMGFASVSLKIDNTDRRLDVDTDEVVIGRRYYRSGDSEYSINGQNVRLKDVYELLLDTGMGRDGYSIIGQGRIAEIVGAKSNERREIFEEASGIAKYRYRKNEAERRLAGAEENLERLRDILGELEGRVGPLQKESEKAKRFLELSAHRKELEVTLWVDNIRRAKETVRDQQRKYETAQADYDRMTAQLETLDAESEDARAAMQALALDIERYNADIRTMTEEMAGVESQIAVLKNNIAHNNATMESLEAERSQGSRGSESILAEMETHNTAIADIESGMAEMDVRLEEMSGRLNRIQADSLKSGERKGAVAAEMTRMTEQQTAARVEATRASTAAATAAERLEAARAESAASQDTLQKTETDTADTRRYLDEVRSTVERLNNMKSGLTLKLNSRRKALDDADQAEQALTKQIERDRDRLQLLRDLEERNDGYQESVKKIMAAAKSQRLRGVVGPVSSLLGVKRGYELAIETALGAAMQNLVVVNEGAAKASIAFLQQAKGRATFLPMDVIHGQHFNGALPEGAFVASKLVQYDPRYDQIVAYLLGRIIVVNDLNEASAVARQLNHRNRVVTVDGQVINAGGSYTGGSSSRSTGLFSRRQEIEDLRKAVEQASLRQEAAQEKTDAAKAEVDKLSAQLTATESEAITAGGDQIRAEMELRRLEGLLSQGQAARELLQAEIESLEGQITADRAAAEKNSAEDARLAAEMNKLSGELAAISGSDDSFLETRSRLSDALTALKMERLSAEKDISLHKAAIETLRSRTGEHARRAAEIATSLETLRALNAENAAKVETILATRKDGQDKIAAKEAAIRAATDARLLQEGKQTELAHRSRAITDEREKMSGEMARLAERKTTAEQEYDATVAKLWEEYQLSQSAAAELCVPFETLTDLRRQVTEVRGKIRGLGNVNVGAIEEYEEVSQRYEFLRTQVGDVEKSKAELTKLITELSGEMQDIFTANFKTINENFGRIFKELFGGGTASLTLDDPENVLECGIEIEVAPPGKVIKNLTALSGGEQSLVAISIYFAILAVNPSPFCILDEIEAALDDVNVVRYAQYLRRISDKTQFIVITHRRGTMEAADVLYGVTMQENGISKLLKLDLDQVDATLVS